MALEKDPNCLPADAGYQLALDGLLGHQAYRPTSPAFGRITAYHRDDALLLGRVQELPGPGPLLLIQRRIQATLVVAMGDLADRFGGQRNRLCHLGRRNLIGQQPQSQRPQNHAHLLNSAAQQFPEFGEILGLDLDRDRAARHASSMHQNISRWKCFIELL